MNNKVYKFTKSGSGARVMIPNKNFKKSMMITGTGLLMKQEITGTRTNPPAVKLNEITDKLEKVHIGGSMIRPLKKSYINFKL